jgi:hypothetical protein
MRGNTTHFNELFLLLFKTTSLIINTITFMLLIHRDMSPSDSINLYWIDIWILDAEILKVIKRFAPNAERVQVWTSEASGETYIFVVAEENDEWIRIGRQQF